MKFLILLVITMVTIVNCEGKSALRRKPKVYNALITTDEDLVQSRAFPVIQPTIHESGIAQYPYNPYNPYGVYNSHLARLAQPLAPALTPREQLPHPLPQVSPQLTTLPIMPQPLTGYPIPQSPPTAPAAEKSHGTALPPTALEEQPQPTLQPLSTMIQTAPSKFTRDPNEPIKMPSEQLPIPLNQYGLPPSLIPLRQPQLHQPSPYPSHFHLPQYRFNPIPPLYYNSLPALRQPFLPPYGHIPTGPQFPLSNTIPTDKIYQPHPNQPLAAPVTEPPTLPSVTTTEAPNQSSEPSSDPITEPSFKDIKNGSKSEDGNVPDVPPPPIPSGAKSKQS